MLSGELKNAILTAFAITLVLFPDAIFMRAGLSQTSQFMGYQERRPLASFYPQPHHRLFHHAYADNGGALWQSEPAQQFLQNCLQKGESPYWNPYSGAGQLGPETLVDLKFSFQAFVISILGGSQTAFNFVLISSYFVAICFLHLFCSRFLQISSLAATAACTVFALNGYSTATQGSNTSQIYLFFPVLLYALVSFSRKPNTLRFILLVLSDAIALSSTFLPTAFLGLCTIHSLALAAELAECSRKQLAKTVLFQAIAILGSILLLGFLYFPIVESFQHIDAISMYSARRFFPASWQSILSLFTPKHFWEEYQAVPAQLYGRAPENHGIQITNSVYHFGVSVWMCALCCLHTTRRLKPIALVCIFWIFISLARIFGVPLITEIIDLTPGFRSLGEQYWFVTTAIAVTLAAGLGMEAIKNSTRYVWVAPLPVFITVLASAFYLYSRLGFLQPDVPYKKLCVTMIFVFAIVSLALIVAAKFAGAWARYCAIGLCLVIGGELLSETMFNRCLKTEYFRKPPLAVQYLKKNCGLWRVINLNRGVMPAEQGAAFGIQQAETLNMNILPHYESFFHRNFLENRIPAWGRFCTLFAMTEPETSAWRPALNLPMLNLLGVKYVVVSPHWSKTLKLLKDNGFRLVFGYPPWQIYESTQVYPRAFLTTNVGISKLIPQGNQDIARRVVFTDDEKLLQEAKALSIAVDAGAFKDVEKLVACDKQSAEITSYHHDNISIQTHLSAPAVLVVTDNWHPNWQATVDGRRAHLGLVDETFRGVAIPAGEHTVKMVYRPRSLSAGQAASGLTILLLGMLLLFRKRVDALMAR